MDGGFGKHPGCHSTGHMDQDHANHGHGDGQFNARHVRKAQTDGVGTQSSQSHQHHGKSSTEQQRQQGVRRGVGKPHRPDERDSKEQQQHDRFVVDVAHDNVVLAGRTASLGAAFLTLSEFEKFSVQFTQPHRGGTVGRHRGDQRLHSFALGCKGRFTLFFGRQRSQTRTDIALEGQVSPDQHKHDER